MNTKICQVSFNFYEEVILTAYPSDSSWEFSHWDDGSSCYQDNPLTVAMDGSKTLTAVFELNRLMEIKNGDMMYYL